MWFKQIQLFQLTDSLRDSPEKFTEKLEPLAFRPCLPSMFSSAGWVSPIDEVGAPLVRTINGRMMLCLQIEEKILPAMVIRQALVEKIKKIELEENRKVYQKEKLSLKDEIIITLLPKAFSKLTRVHAYIDTQNQWLVLGTNNAKKIEQFLSMFKKSISENVHPYELDKLSPIMTHWLKKQSLSSAFGIEKSCVLQDADQQSRVIRCQQQNLFASSIQSLLNDGCAVKQLALSWHDQVQFVLADHFSLSGLKYQDQVVAQAGEMEAETKQQQFDADFLIMAGMLSNLLKDLLGVLMEHVKEAKKVLETA